jgi:hypothetical protein
MQSMAKWMALKWNPTEENIYEFASEFKKIADKLEMGDAQRCMRFKLAMPDSIQYILAEALTMPELWLKIEMHLTTILSVITTQVASLHPVASLPATTPVNPTTSLFSAQSTKPKQNTHSQQQQQKHDMLEVQMQHKIEKLQMEHVHSQELMNERLEYLRADQQKKQYGNKTGGYKPGYKPGAFKPGGFKSGGFKPGGYKPPGAPSFKPKGSFQGTRANSPAGNKTPIQCHYCGGPHVMRLCHRIQDCCEFLEEQKSLDRVKLAEQSRQREKFGSLSDQDMHNLQVMRQCQLGVEEAQEECVEETQEEGDESDFGQECNPEFDQQYEENSSN